jgi:hypothetical protein
LAKETRRYKFKPLPPAEVPTVPTGARIIDERWRLGIRTIERIKEFTLQKDVHPVLSIPLTWNPSLKSFELGYYPAVQVGDKAGALINPATEDTLLSAFKHEERDYIASQTVTADGDSGATPLIIDYGSAVTFFLYVTAVSGTSPTLDMYVDICGPAADRWVNQDKFPTISAVGDYALALPVRARKYRCRWVLGGTTPSFTFAVGAVIVK